MSEEIKKSKIKIFLINAWEEFKYNLGYCLGQLTPIRRFMLVLIFGGALGTAYICILYKAVYNIGKRDAERQFLEIRHIESPDFQLKQNSINFLNQEEYEYQYEQ